jgi:cation diffusion facilitator family transporter
MSKSANEQHSSLTRTDSNRRQIRAGRRVTLTGSAVNLFLIGFKFVAGWLGQSQALIADAAHSVSDLCTDLVVLFGLRLGRRAPDTNHHFGHARIETLASAIVGLGLIGVAVYLGIASSSAIYHHTEKHPTWIALAAAAVSIALKEGLYHYTKKVGRRIQSPVVIANAWHHRSDALSSVAVLLGVGGAQLRPDWHILDAYAALVVSLLVLKVGFEVLRDAVREFTDTAPDPRAVEKIKRCSRSVEGVLGMHDLKVRTSGGRYQMELHIVVESTISVAQGHRIAKEVEACICEDFHTADQVIVHVDPSVETAASG